MALTTASTATTLTFSAPNQQSDGNSQGQSLTNSPTDKLSAFGGTPVVQPNIGAANLLAGTVYDTALVTKYQLTNATVAVGATTTAEVTTTVCTGLTTTDVVGVNKPTTTAGLGVSGYRVTAANKVGLAYSNPTTTAATTSAETYDVVGFSSTLTVTTALTPAAVAATTTSEQFFTVAGATLGSFPIVNKPTTQAGLGIGNVRVSAENQVAITYLNNSSGAITPTAAETYSFAFVPTLVPASNTLVYNVQQASTAVGASTAVEVTTAITGLATTDVISGVSKPTSQAGLGVIGYRVTSAGNIGITMYEGSSAVTSTAETYAITVTRPIAKAPCVVTSQTLTPVSVAANTTAEQTFTVNSLNASTSVFVSKPSHTPGISIVGSRVSAASTLAIAYQNNNSTAVVPPAELYNILAVPLQGPGAIATTGTSQSIQVAVSPMASAAKDLRAALLALNFMAAT